MKFSRILLSAALLGLALPAFASDTAPRWEVSGSIFAPKVQLTASTDVDVSDGTDSFNVNGFPPLEDQAFGGQIDGSFRLTPRQTLSASFYRVRTNETGAFDRTESFEDGNGDPVVVNANGTGRLITHFNLYRVSYGFDVISRDRFTLTANGSIYGADMSFDARSAGTLTATDINGTETYDLTGSTDYGKSGLAPGLGLSSKVKFTDKLSARISAQGFLAQWGVFNYEGRFFNARTTLDYAFTDRFTGFVGYDWFDLRFKGDAHNGPVIDGTTYTFDGPVSARLRVQGPAAGVRVSF